MIGGKFVLDTIDAYKKLNKKAYEQQNAMLEPLSAGYASANKKAYESRTNVEEKLGQSAIGQSSLAKSYNKANEEIVKKVTDPNIAV